MGRNQYRVRDVASLSGVSVRTLHHYDAIGLLVPKRTRADYRVYSGDDLLRLQQILIGRELGMSLQAIAASLDDPSFDRKQALLMQKVELERRVSASQRMIRAIDAAIASLESTTKDIPMNELFEGIDPTLYEAEAKARWGSTEAYKESKRRTSQYTPDDWSRFKAAQRALYAALNEALRSGEPATGAAAMKLAEKHRLLIDQWFYPCSHRHHSALADMYEHDTRFKDNIDRHGAGLTAFLSTAIRANSVQGASEA